MAITTKGIRDNSICCRDTRVKFLIDECLSPELVRIARERGYGESTHVTWLGLRSRKDWSIVRRAVDDGYVLVTNNTTDFTPLLSREGVHAGLVCLNVAPGLMSLDVQKRLFTLALDRLGDAEPINELLEVTLLEDRLVRIDRYNVPPGK
jgi:predicted nuclease of predicted toxin-antitoxin system